jgi:ketosteroid isomerase-like protein
MTSDPNAVATVVAFNEAINARDLPALGELMTESHRFIDSAGTAVEGKAACLAAWEEFFEGFPDYRNVFDVVQDDPDGVRAQGRSECSDPALEGPAEWHAVVTDGRVAVWRVSEPQAAPGA